MRSSCPARKTPTHHQQQLDKVHAKQSKKTQCSQNKYINFKEKLNDNFIYNKCFLGRTHIGWELETGKAVGDDDIVLIPGEVLCG